MALKQADRLESNNPKAYGIAKAIEITGHRSVATLTDLYALPDAILSDTKTNTANDAIGQLWYVVSEGVFYQLIAWDTRKASAGWKKSEYTTKDVVDAAIKTLTDKVTAAETDITNLSAKTVNGKRIDTNPVLIGTDINLGTGFTFTDLTKEQASVAPVPGDSLESSLEKLFALLGFDATKLSDHDTYFSQIAKNTGLGEIKTPASDSFALPDLSSTNYLGASTSLADGLKKLDTATKKVETDLATLEGTKGQASGLASLDSSGKVPSSQLPSYVDDVLDIYATYTKSATGELSNIKIYSDAAHTTTVTGETGKIYVNITDGEPGYSFRWSGTQWIHISAGSLVIGTVAGTAYDGAEGDANRKSLDSLPTNIISVVDTPNANDRYVSLVFKSVGKNSSKGNNVYDPITLPITFTREILAATTTKAGVMSATDKTDLTQVKTRMDGIYEGNKALPTPVITGSWTYFKNDGTTAATITPTPDANNPRIEKGYKAKFTGTYKWTTEAGKKDPTQVQSGSSWTALPISGVSSSSYTSAVIGTNTTVKIGIQAEKTGLMVSGSSVVPASGYDTAISQRTVTFLDRIFFGKATSKAITEVALKALSSSELVSSRVKTVSGITCAENEYYVYSYPASLGDLSTIIQDGATPVLGAFTLSKLTITNDAGLSIPMNVYVSNNPGAFTGSTLEFK